MLDLGQMKLLVHFVQQVLLDDCVHHHGDEQVKEDGRDVLGALGVRKDILKDARLDFSWDSHIVMQGYEDRGRRAADLEHQPHHEDHGHAGDDIRMVLDDELVAQDRRVLGLFSLDDHPAGPLALLQKFLRQLSVEVVESSQWEPTVANLSEERKWNSPSDAKPVELIKVLALQQAVADAQSNSFATETQQCFVRNIFPTKVLQGFYE